jgi:hypothetical protein
MLYIHSLRLQMFANGVTPEEASRDVEVGRYAVASIVALAVDLRIEATLQMACV